MSYLRFNHVFFGLMALALVSAFVFSPVAGDTLKGSVVGAFLPVSYPANRVGKWVHDRVAGSQTRDIVSPGNPRDAQALREENQQLHLQVLNMKGQLELLIEREESRAQMGELRSRCTPVTVMGADSGPRESLILASTSFAGMRDGMPVLFPGGLVGRLSAVGVGGARVTLITDPSFRIIVNFTRAVHGADGTIDYPTLPIEPKLAIGVGDGKMTVQLTEQEKNGGLRKDDWVILADNDWPRELRNFRLGFVDSIEATRDPGFFLVTIRPDQNLKQLQEVMVMNK